MDHLSANQMNLYFQCGLKYQFQYIHRLPKPFKASGLVFGSDNHSAIFWFHINQLAGRSVPLEKLNSISNAASTPILFFGACRKIWFRTATRLTVPYRDTPHCMG